ncbi:hypothetical protein HPB47_023550 [Ixodes persulcatus]|uniref:Uncharacterized protein n=1 Tax=Ixodes persulcatus TaxID=34615 RepID=A0AC60Q6P8_IXOPE|nr:hypothetical protein HPB47_023550 [Ixodes persulcatus]
MYTYQNFIDSSSDIYFINAIAVTSVKARHCAYAIRNGCYPTEVLNLFQIPPSTGHAKRITKILRAETGRQVRLLHDGLKLVMRYHLTLKTFFILSNMMVSL